MPSDPIFSKAERFTDAVIFALKTFGASMLAYWIALRFGLDNPYWAAGTVFIVANPLSGPILAQRVRGWLKNASSLTQDVLAGQGDSQAVLQERHRLAADAVDLRAFGTYSGFEGANGRVLRNHMQALQRHMVLILPLLSEITDALAQLRAQDSDFDQPYPLVNELASWLGNSDPGMLDQADQLLAALAAERRRLEAQDDSWSLLLRLRLTKRLEDLLAVWRDCRLLEQDIERGESHALIRRVPSGGGGLHTDYGMAFYCALAAVAAIMVACLLWIETGWKYGWNVAMMTAVLSSVMATLDDARPVLRKVLQLILMAAGAVFVFQFAIMPSLTGFWPLVGALGLYLIPCGILIAHPTGWLMGFQLSVNLIYMLALDDRASANMTAYLSGSLAVVLAVLISMLTLSTVRAVGAEYSAQRLLQAAWRTVRDSASGARRPDTETVVHRMLDRMGLLVPRLAALPAGSAILGSDFLRDLRVSLDVLKIQSGKACLPTPVRMDLEALLKALEAHDRARLGSAKTLPADSLIPAIDACLGQLLPQPGIAERRVKDALVGLRGTLCPQATGPQPALGEIRMVR